MGNRVKKAYFYLTRGLGILLLIILVCGGYIWREIGELPDVKSSGYDSLDYHRDGRFISPEALISAVPKVYREHRIVNDDNAGWFRFMKKSSNGPLAWGELKLK